MTDTPPKRRPLTPAALWFITRETMSEWNEDKVPRLGAALAFYSMLSIGPLLLIVISMAGLAFGRDAVSGYIFNEIRGLVGDVGAQAIQTIIANSRNQSTGMLATAIGIATLIVSATGFFAQMQDALNTIWNVEGGPNGDWWSFIRKRFLSFTMIVAIGFLLLVALVVSAALSAVSGYISGFLPRLLMHGVNLLASFAVVTLLFAMIFKVLPDVHIKWRDVWIGSGLTALLFSFGKLLIGIYLGRSAFTSTYGAAGSLIVVLVWVYYSTQIFFIGAEFTQVYARYMGEQIVMKRGRRRPIVQAAGHSDRVKVAEVVNVAKSSAAPAKPEL